MDRYGAAGAGLALVSFTPQVASADMDRLKRQVKDAKEDARHEVKDAREDVDDEKKDAKDDVKREKKDAEDDVKRDLKH